MWLSLLRSPDWASLVVVPADPSVSAKACTDALADVARLYDIGSVKVRDATTATAAEAEQIAADLHAADGANRLVVPVAFPLVDPSGLPLILRADAALVALRFGAADVGSTRVIIDVIGRDRILGCIAVAGPAPGGRARPDAKTAQ